MNCMFLYKQDLIQKAGVCPTKAPLGMGAKKSSTVNLSLTKQL